MACDNRQQANERSAAFLDSQLQLSRSLIEYKVQEAMKEYDRKMESEKIRLRRLITEEQRNLDKEKEAIESNLLQSKREEIKRKCLEFEAKAKREQDEYIKKQTDLQKILSYDETRELMQKHRQDAIQRDRMWQIQEKLKALESLAQEENFYHALIVRNVEQAIEEDKEAVKKKLEKQKETKVIFDQQLELKKMSKIQELHEKAKERKEIEEMVKKFKECELQEQRAKLERAKIFALEMKNFAERQKEIMRSRKSVENDVETNMCLIEDSAAVMNKTKLKEELDLFRQHAEEIRRKQENERIKFEEEIDKLNQKRKLLEEEEIKKVEAAKRELSQMVFKEREEQMYLLRMRERQEQEEKLTEIGKFQKEQCEFMMLREQEEVKARERKKKYAKELQEQIFLQNERKRQEKMERLKYEEARKKDEENRKKEIELLTKSFQQNPSGFFRL